jgi:epoxyqueuosine reductase
MDVICFLYTTKAGQGQAEARRRRDPPEIDAEVSQSADFRVESIMDATERIFDVAQSEGVPVMGTAACGEMERELPGYRPQDLLRGARSLICFGLPVPDAVYFAGAHGMETVWRSQNLLYRRLDTLSLAVAEILEEGGARALPIYGCLPMAVNRRREVAGYLNMLRMGEISGIGVIGKNGLLLNSRYGSRLMLGGVITTAELPVRRTCDGEETGCPEGCRICVDACPVRAITGKPGRKRVHVMRCLSYTSRTPAMSRLVFGLLARANPGAAARYMNPRAFDEHTMHVCSRCVALCPYGGQESSSGV